MQNIVHRITGVSIKFEVGSWLEFKNNRLYEQGAVSGPLKIGGFGGMLPQKSLKSESSEMPFPAFSGHQIDCKR